MSSAGGTVPACKILVLGDVLGNFTAAATKISKLNKSHGPFTAAFCVGRFFGDTSVNDFGVAFQPIESGTVKFDIPVYFILGDEHKTQTSVVDRLPDGGAIAPNLTYLGRSGVKTVEGGLRVAYLSGLLDDNVYADPERPNERAFTYFPNYCDQEVAGLLAQLRRTEGGVDLLLTAEWGKGWDNLIADGPPVPGLRDPRNTGVEPVALIASAVSFRYHFAGTERVFYSLAPYRGPSDVPSRFYGLAELGNTRKAKDVFACSITPVGVAGDAAVAAASASDAAVVTACPYTSDRKRPAPGAAAAAAAAAAATAAAVMGDGVAATAAGRPAADKEDDGAGAKKRRTGADSSVDDVVDLGKTPAAAAATAAAAAGPGLGVGVPPPPPPPPPGYPAAHSLIAAAGGPVGPFGGGGAPALVARMRELEAEDALLQARAGVANGFMRWNVRPPAGYVCHLCNTADEHYIRDCPAKAARDAAREAERAQRSSKPPAGYVCHICNKADDHYIRECPDKAARDAAREAERAERGSKPPPGYVCHICNKVDDHFIRECPDKAERDAAREAARAERDAVRALRGEKDDVDAEGRAVRAPRPPAAMDKDCWFCLSTANAATHLIVSVGDETYMAMPRGPLCDDHVLILPIKHVGTSVELAADAADELERYKRALKVHAASSTHYVLFYERHVPTRATQHMQFQAVQLDVKQALVAADVLQQEFKSLGLSLEELPEDMPLDAALANAPSGVLPMPDGVVAPYVYFEIPDVAADSPLASRRFLFRVPLVVGPSPGMPPQPARIQGLFDLPRTVAASVVGRKERTDWKAVAGTTEEETALALKFKEAFKPHDFTLQ